MTSLVGILIVRTEGGGQGMSIVVDQLTTEPEVPLLIVKTFTKNHDI